MKSTFEIHGLYGFRHVDLDVVATIQHSEDYLDVTELFVFSSRKNCMVKASPRLTLAFQEKNWERLEEACQDHMRDQAEIYREILADVGCMKATERMEREAERRAA